MTDEKAENEMTVKIKYEDDGKGKWQSVSARVEVDGDDYFLPGIGGFGETKEEAKEDLKSNILPLLVQVENLLQLGKPKWHDLRKDPSDLPKDKGDYWVKYNDLHEERGGYYDVHYFNPNNSFYKQKWHKLEVIAWCELPKFEE